MSELIITKDNFEAEVLNSKLPVLLDFWAVWCGPCRMLSPIVAEIAEENEDKIKVGKVNVDEQPELAEVFSVSSIPMLVWFRDGKPVSVLVGYQPKEAILEMMKK